MTNIHSNIQVAVGKKCLVIRKLKTNEIIIFNENEMQDLFIGLSKLIYYYSDSE